MNILKQKSIKNQLLNKRKESLNSLSSIGHRLDFFSNKQEKIWINDSKSTSEQTKKDIVEFYKIKSQ